MTNWTSRNSTVDLSFLPAGKKYLAQIYKDGANADTEPTEYDVATNEVNSATKLSIKMASGGGFVVRLRQM
jgi:alpha-glucosidase